jgi:large subunit ribosomal protein L23
MPVQLFPNWVVKLVRSPNLRTNSWLNRAVEVFHVSPKMTKFEIKEYLIKLYDMPVSHVHTAIYNGRKKTSRVTGLKYQEPDFKKAYVYLQDSQGDNKHRYHEIAAQQTDAAQDAWPTKPNRLMPELRKKAERGPTPPRSRNQARTRPMRVTPYDGDR